MRGLSQECSELGEGLRAETRKGWGVSALNPSFGLQGFNEYEHVLRHAKVMQCLKIM